METKQIKVISIKKEEFDNEVSFALCSSREADLDRLSHQLSLIKECTDQLLASSDWVPMRGGLYFNRAVNAVFPDPKSYIFGHCPINRLYDDSTFQPHFDRFDGALMNLEELKRAFSGHSDWLRKYMPAPIDDIYFTIDDLKVCYSYNGVDFKKWGSFSRNESYHIPIFRLCNDNLALCTGIQILFLWMNYQLIPRDFPDDLAASFLRLINLLGRGKEYFLFEKNRMELNHEKIMEDIMDEKFKLLSDDGVDVSNLQNSMQGHMPMSSYSKRGMSELVARLLNCDTVRCDVESYDEKILSDPNRGHWDLWDEPDSSSKYTVKLEGGMIARNPLSDIKHDGVIGIDFGTKSTVVVCQESTEHTLPMRIGTGRISSKVEAFHYENPTVMEMIDLDSFLERYYASEGRPETRWEDLVISHTANESMLRSSSTEYYSFFNELKQWAGDKRRQIRLKDKKNKDILLPPFLDIEDGEFNPIEIYAYYVGLYINNMHNGIYLDYILSFPVTYESAVRKKITKSFELGLKKSLPNAVLRDEEVMKKFRVSSGISEPAAYAICALEDCYSDLEDNGKIYYGIFDFGGGTTDFDYGVWRETDANERKYDYVLECFGAGGDQYLGGESLLELLAFEVFKENQDILRNERISFVLPPECKKFPGSEVLLSGSQEAKLNSRQLMEVLRPFWEHTEGYDELYQNGKVHVTLFNKEGDEKPDFELSVTTEHMKEILKERIRKGVVNFFEGLKAAFTTIPQDHINQIDIFLAGNSSRSIIVTELFEEQIEVYKNAFSKNEDSEPIRFIIHAPLGFSDKKGSETDPYETPRTEEENFAYVTRPNGKTGVAFGLIEGRPGGRIKVVLPDLPKDTEGNSTEIKFKYYIGYKKKNCFRIISDRDVPYGNWIELYEASIADFTVYYTSLPEALTGQMSILDVSKKNCRLAKTYRDANIYYRPISPTVIEYVVARPDDLEKGEYLEELVTIELN